MFTLVSIIICSFIFCKNVYSSFIFFSEDEDHELLRKDNEDGKFGFTLLCNKTDKNHFTLPCHNCHIYSVPEKLFIKYILINNCFYDVNYFRSHNNCR